MRIGRSFGARRRIARKFLEGEGRIGVVGASAGNARKSRRLVNSSVYGLYGFAALVTLASVLLIYAMVTHDFAIKYVASVSDTTMETWYKVTSFWGGLALP